MYLNACDLFDNQFGKKDRRYLAYGRGKNVDRHDARNGRIELKNTGNNVANVA
jgi:hypothetical protein